MRSCLSNLHVVPYNSPESIANAHSRKEAKENYNMLLGDMEAKGYSASLLVIEIGSLGHSLTSTQAALSRHFRIPSLSKQGVKKRFDESGKVAICASYFIVLERRDQLWNSECQQSFCSHYHYTHVYTFFS